MDSNAPSDLSGRITWSEVSDFRGLNVRSFSEQERTLRDILELLEGLGFSVNSSRIRSYQDALRTIKEKASLNRNMTIDDGLRLLGTSVELSQLEKILRAARTAPNLWRHQLEKLISGTHAHVSLKLSPAWDFQYEIFIASVAQLSGYEITYEEPDVVVKDKELLFGIAAKRPKSAGAIKRNLDKASRQVDKSKRDGIIAMDCSAIIANGMAITTTDRLQAGVLVKALLDRLMDQKLSIIRGVQTKDFVFGVLLSLHMPVTIVDENWQYAESFCSAFRWTLIPLVEPSDPRFNTVMRFAENCKKGLFSEEA